MWKDTKMTKCQFFDCENEAEKGYPCCSSNHGIALKQNIRILPVLFDADEARRINYRGLIDLEQVEHYSKLINRNK